MKLKCVLFGVSSIVLSSTVFARTDCPAAKVQYIQIEGNVILYAQEGSSWHRLGTLNEEGTKERYSALLASQAAGKKVIVGYPSDTYNCSAVNYVDSANMLRTLTE